MSRNIRHDCKINSIKTDLGGTNSPEVMSETFNQYFTEIGPNLAEKLPNSSKTHSDFIGHVDSSFQLEPVTLPKVLKLLKNISADKTTGLDKIPCRLVKLVQYF